MVLDIDKIISIPRIRCADSRWYGLYIWKFHRSSQDLAFSRAGALPAPLKIAWRADCWSWTWCGFYQSGRYARRLLLSSWFAFACLCLLFLRYCANIAVFFNLILLFAALSLTHTTLHYFLPELRRYCFDELYLWLLMPTFLINDVLRKNCVWGAEMPSTIDAGYSQTHDNDYWLELDNLEWCRSFISFGSRTYSGFAVTASSSLSFPCLLPFRSPNRNCGLVD